MLASLNACCLVRYRLASLYSDFRQLRTTNPDGYDANIDAWVTALTRAARQGLLPSAAGQGGGHQNDQLILNVGPDLLQALETRQWGRPQALGVVIV